MNSFSSIVFFNNANNGDVFYSKEYIRFFAKNLGVRAYHSHSKCPSLISDLRIPHMRINTAPLFNHSFHQENGVLYMNTWIAQNNKKWWDGCTLRNNHRMYTDHAIALGLSLPKEEHLFIPEIDWKHYGVDQFFLNTERNILISNGNVLSGQTVNWDMTPMIISLARKHPSCTFYVTHPFPTDISNVVDANTFFNYGPNRSNLNEISRLSTDCAIIVGRSSGPYSFTHTKENLFDETKTFICSSNGMEEGHWAVLDDYSLDKRAKQLWVECHVHKNNDCSGDLFELVDSEINLKFGSN